MHQGDSEQIKHRVLKPTILHLPDNKGKFQLFSDASKTAGGLASYWVQNGIPKLIGCANIRLPNYSSKLFNNRIRVAMFMSKYQSI